MTSILVVDDNEAFREAVCSMLSDGGHQIAVAGNGREALALLQRQDVELMLTDLVMPDMEGMETIRQIRKRHPLVKIIAMSGGGRNDAGDYLRLARCIGAVSTIEKPFKTRELLDLVQQVTTGG